MIWLYEMEERTFNQIGEQIGISEEGARKRFRTAMPRLMQKVSQLQNGELCSLLDSPAAS